MEEQKKSGGTIALIVIGVIIILMLGYIGYEVSKGKSITNIFSGSDSKGSNTSETTTTKATTNESNIYSNFMNFYKEGRPVVYESFNASEVSGQKMEITSFKIDTNGNLILSLSGNLQSKYGSTYKLDTNVYTAKFITYGNSAYQNLYYVKEDGYVYHLDSTKINNSELSLIKDANAKEIVSLSSCAKDIETSGSMYACAIDINGHTFAINN